MSAVFLACGSGLISAVRGAHWSHSTLTGIRSWARRRLRSAAGVDFGANQRRRCQNCRGRGLSRCRGQRFGRGATRCRDCGRDIWRGRGVWPCDEQGQPAGDARAGRAPPYPKPALAAGADGGLDLLHGCHRWWRLRTPKRLRIGRARDGRLGRWHRREHFGAHSTQTVERRGRVRIRRRGQPNQRVRANSRPGAATTRRL